MKPSNPSKVVSRTREIKAPAQTIFDLLADPRRHHEIDGSGSVQAAQMNAPDRLSLGAKFGMNMKIGLPYRITNTVVEFEEGRQIGWRHFGGHVWRYILEPTETGTIVTEQFDWTNNRLPLMLKVMNAIENNAKSMEKTLENLARRFENQ